METTVIEPDLDDRKHIDFELNLKVLHYLGILPPPDVHGIGYSALYGYYTTFGMLLLGSCVFSQFIDVFVCWGDFDAFTINVSSMLSFAVCLYKFVKTVQMRQDIHDLMERLDRIFIVYIDHDANSSHILEDSEWHAKAVTIGFLGLGGLAVVFWCFMRPIQWISSFLIHTMGVVDRSTGCHNRNLPLIAWLPFNTTVSPFYEMTYVYHTLASLYSYLVSASLDVFYVSVIIHVCGELKLLQHSLLNITSRAVQKAKEKEDAGLLPPPLAIVGGGDGFNGDDDADLEAYIAQGSTLPPTPPRSADDHKTIKIIDGEETLHRRGRIWEFTVSKEMKRREDALLNIEMYRALIRCIEHHQELLNFTYALEAKMNYIMIVQFLGSMIIICMAVYQVTVSTHEAVNFIKYMVNLLSMLVQILLYCWYGQSLIDQSEGIMYAAYNCDWLDSANVFKRSLSFIIMRAQHPLQLTAGKFYAISLHSFLLILEASLSFFAVLRQISK